MGRKVNKRGFLADLYATASQSIGLAVAEDSEAIQMFRVMLAEHQHLCGTRAAIEQQADQALQSQPDYQRLRTLPGVGPILALTILAEAGDLRRFPHHRQFLTFCGFDLSTQQSGQFRGISRLSKLAMRGSAMPFGWPRMGRSGCGRTRFAKSMHGRSRLIPRIRIASARPSVRSPPRWHAWHMACSRLEAIIGRMLRHSPPVEHSVRVGRRGRG